VWCVSIPFPCSPALRSESVQVSFQEFPLPEERRGGRREEKRF